MQAEVTSLVDLNDSEIIVVEHIVALLNESAGHDDSTGAKRINLEGFNKEIVERFAEGAVLKGGDDVQRRVAFNVKVSWFTTNFEDVYVPRIEIQSRREGSFDPDRQVHEVTHDLLGIEGAGVIKTGFAKGHILGES